LFEAVYAAELDDVAASASALLGQFPPDAALRAWMDRYATFRVTKHAMLSTLRPGFAPGRISPSTRERLITALTPIIAHGAEQGSLRTDIRPDGRRGPAARCLPLHGCQRHAGAGQSAA